MHQWAGRGETREVTNFVTIPYLRYPRTFVPPYSVQLTIEESSSEKLVLAPELVFNNDNEKLIVHCVNLILEIFGECQVFKNNLVEIKKREIINLNWEILPKDERPWEQVERGIDEFVYVAKKSYRSVIAGRLKELYKYSPDFEARGRSGFSGYIVLGYQRLGLYVLESIYTNNATYVFNNNWEELSKLTKADIIYNDLQKDRIIHSDNWNLKIKKLLE
jgi:hypothetical protein